MSHVQVKAAVVLAAANNYLEHIDLEVKLLKRRDITHYYRFLVGNWKRWRWISKKSKPTPKQARDTYTADWGDGFRFVAWTCYGHDSEKEAKRLRTMAQEVIRRDTPPKVVTITPEHAWLLKWADRPVAPADYRKRKTRKIKL